MNVCFLAKKKGIRYNAGGGKKKRKIQRATKCKFFFIVYMQLQLQRLCIRKYMYSLYVIYPLLVKDREIKRWNVEVKRGESVLTNVSKMYLKCINL